MNYSSNTTIDVKLAERTGERTYVHDDINVTLPDTLGMNEDDVVSIVVHMLEKYLRNRIGKLCNCSSS